LLVIHLLRKYLWGIDQKLIWFFKSYWYNLHLPLVIDELIYTGGLLAVHALIVNFFFVYLLFPSYIYLSILVKFLLYAFLCFYNRFIFISTSTLSLIYNIHLFLNFFHPLFLARMIWFFILFIIIFFVRWWPLFTITLIFSFNW